MHHSRCAANFHASVLILAAFLTLVGALVGQRAQAAGNPMVAAFYQVDRVTDLGPEVRVSLRLRLINPSDDVLLIDHIALHTLMPGANRKGPGYSASTVLEPHSSETPFD